MIKTPNPIDQHVGSRLRLKRTSMGMSQQKVAAALGLTFQQIQKYERGANRIGASRLYQISQILDVPVSFFFDEIPEPQTEENTADQAPAPTNLADRKSLEFMKDWTHLSPQQKSAVHKVVKSMSFESKA